MLLELERWSVEVGYTGGPMMVNPPEVYRLLFPLARASWGAEWINILLRILQTVRSLNYIILTQHLQ